MKYKRIVPLLIFISITAIPSCSPLKENANVTPLPTSTAVLDGTSPFTEESSSNPATGMPGYEKKTIDCSVYVETTWGSGENQWGDPIQLPSHSRTQFSPLEFSETGDIYISDFPNKRLLKYDGAKQYPVQTIALPEKYYSDPPNSPLFPWNIIVTKTNVLVPYGLDKLGVLSLDGHVVKDIQLPYRYNPMAPVRKPVWVDSQGRLLLNGEKIVYFDVGWDEGVWKELAVGTDFIRNPQLWGDYLIGESGVQPNYHKYKIDLSKNFLEEPIKLDIDLDIGTHILGVDQKDWIYFKKAVETEHTIIRYGLQASVKQFGIIDNSDITNIVETSVAPNGIIYLIVYEPEDQSTQPKMFRCSFTNN